MAESLVDRLFLGQCASCSCLTKTLDVQYHDEHCRYRLLSEAADRIRILESAVRFYAHGHHFVRDESGWDTVTGEPQNFWCDDRGTSTIEDGTIAKKFLLGEWTKWDDDEVPALLPEERTTQGE